MGTFPATLAFLLDWGWLRIGPYIHINIDPAILRLGGLKLTWYGLAYVVGIVMGLWFIRNYTERKGITQDQVYRVLWWCIVAGVVGGRLYYVIQQPDLVQDFLLQPWRILATWEGGMAFFGAIFLILPTLFWRSLKMRVNPLVMLDAGALFAACGQLFGRFGNLINGDIIGYPSTLPWSTVYDNPNSWACPNPATCHVPVQPAAGYEMILNIILLIVLLFLARRYRKPGALMATYLFGYAITQFLVFFVRANIVVPLGSLDWGLKQAQWTALIVFILLIPITILTMRTRYARPVPAGEVAATYGIPQETAPALPDDEDGSSTAASVAQEPDSENKDDDDKKVQDDPDSEQEGTAEPAVEPDPLSSEVTSADEERVAHEQASPTADSVDASDKVEDQTPEEIES
jgi:phosphatidylglycerol:prolipoprotein diacylglycerol transferase